MTFLSILLALILERVTPQLLELRRFEWLRDYTRWLDDALQISRLGSWPGLLVLLLPLLLITWILDGMFHNALFGLFELAFNVAVVFMCLGPQDLDKQVDQYIDSIELGNEEQRLAIASQISEEPVANELRVQVPQVCHALLSEANRRIFAVLFWFMLLGPVAAVLYRLLEQWYRPGGLDERFDEMRKLMKLVLGGLDWVTVRLTLFAYMISGNFDEGLRVYRQGHFNALTTYELNSELLQLVGFSCLVSSNVDGPEQAIDMVRKSRGLILRSLVAWMLLVLLLGWIS